MISTEDGFTPQQIAKVRKEADPWLRAAVQKGLWIGIVLGVVFTFVILAALQQQICASGPLIR